MKLLVVTPFYKPAYVYGGPVRSIPSLCEGLTSIGNDVTVYTTNANGKENFGKEKSKLFPTDIGRTVTDFLIANFHDILDYNLGFNNEN